MKSALIGYTGFVGSTLLRQRPFDEQYNSKNIREIAGQQFDLIDLCRRTGREMESQRRAGAGSCQPLAADAIRWLSAPPAE